MDSRLAGMQSGLTNECAYISDGKAAPAKQA